MNTEDVIANLKTGVEFIPPYLNEENRENYYNAVDKAIEALEKQIPKKPNIDDITTTRLQDGQERTLEFYRCPACGEILLYHRGCSNNDCRQAIDWSNYDK